MVSFFTLNETKSDKISQNIYTCFSCSLYKDADNPKMEPYGKFKKGILNIGMSPTAVDDRAGKPFQDENGRLLRRAYKKHGIDIYNDCLNINAVNCYTQKIPTQHQVNCCRTKVLNVIKQYKPKIIVLLGMEAVQSIIGHRFKKDMENVHKWRGWTIPDRDLKAWVCPTLNLKYVHDSQFKEVGTIWSQDIANIASLLDEPFPDFVDESKYITYLDDPDINESEFTAVIDHIITDHDLAFFDYEITGLKPYSGNHEILCCSIAVSPTKCYSFKFPKNKRSREKFNEFLKSPIIGKGAANMKFEQTWSVIECKTGVYPWVWDTMLGAHALDNRPNITSLKFQTYIRFGVVDYDSHLDTYKKSIDGTTHGLNRFQEYIAKNGIKNLLTYCGLDSIYTYKIGLWQMSQFGFDYKKGGILI